jgi:hypothetical protein
LLGEFELTYYNLENIKKSLWKLMN